MTRPRTSAALSAAHIGGYRVSSDAMRKRQRVTENDACPPREVPPSPVQPGLRAIITSVSPGQSQKIPSAERLARSARTSPAKSSRRSPNRCGAEDEREEEPDRKRSSGED